LWALLLPCIMELCVLGRQTFITARRRLEGEFQLLLVQNVRGE